jgi:hypothetical protein
VSEAILTADLIERLAGDFEVRSEVRGIHPIEGVAVRIDLMARARPHLVLAGFANVWFGIECKWAAQIGGTTSKMTRMVWQSITYAQSTFALDGEEIRPSFVAVYTPDNLHSSIEGRLNHLLALGLYGTVGRLYFYRDGAWGIKFANIYARAPGPGYHLNQSQLPKRRVGSV